MVRVELQVFTGPGEPFADQHLEFDPATDLGEGESLVRIDLATICGSDIHTIDGKRDEETPSVLGHEAVGTVIATRGQADLDEGTRVTWTIADSCGHCAPCVEHDLPQKCEHLFKYGHAALSNGTGLNGCYASHVVLRAGTHVVVLPDEVPDAVAAPANCALATMVHAVDLWRCHRASSPMQETGNDASLGAVLVQGGGLLGVYGCALLREAGARVVFCVEVDEARFPLIEQFGGTPIDGRDAKSATAQILEQCPDGVDAAFEVAGSKQLLSQGAEVLRIGGFYGWVGLVHPDSAIDMTAELVIRKCLTLRGIHNYRPFDLEHAIAFLARNVDRLPFTSLVSPPIALGSLSEAVELSRQRRFMRVALVP
jgi:putative phosphonate catabolism associated alcohol dehydrogenase